MSPEALKAHLAVNKAKEDLATAEHKLKEIINKCDHEWETKYDPIIREAYTTPEFRAGSDFTPACHVPREEKARWRRTCQRCGHEEFTEKTTEKKETLPIF